MEKRVRPIAEGMNAKVIMSCDVTKEDEVKAVFDELEKGFVDFRRDSDDAVDGRLW